jgi:hypothetical protein
MTAKPKILLPLVATLVVLALATGATFAEADPPPAKHARSCFSLGRWHGGWRAASKDLVYIGTDGNEVWRLDLDGGSPELLWPNRILINIARGDDTVCAPIDLDLFVSDGHGFKTPLFVKSITKLTPEEVAALPAKFHP